MEFDINYIKQHVNIEDLAKHLGICVGHDHKAKCPFHDDKNPSLHFYENRFHCFACGENGDIFNLVMQEESLDFAGALKYICNWANIQYQGNIKKYSMQSSKNHGLDLAYELYKNLSDAEQLKQWAQKREIPIELLTQLGAIFLDGSAITSNRQKELNRAEWAGLLAAGVITKNVYAKKESNQTYLDLGFVPQDIFYYAGVLFPIKNSEGEISGFAYRAAELADNKVPKYKYNQYFAKDSNLWGIDQVEKKLVEFKKSNRSNTSAVFDLFIVEGIMDAIRLQNINLNACSILGASIGNNEYKNKDIAKEKKQLELIQQIVEKLSGFTVKIHIFLDNDSTGIAGAKKSFFQFLKLTNDFPNLQFDYLYFPPKVHGKDPDEICKCITEDQVEELLSSNIYSPADFIVSAELNLSPSEMIQQWDSLHFWDRRNAISRLSNRISPAGEFDFSGLLYCGIAENEQNTNSEASKTLIAEFSRVATKEPIVIPSSGNVEEIQWGNALRKARDSYSSDDFPVDQAGWDRCSQGLTTLRYILSEILENSPVIEPYTPAIIRRKLGEAPRLLTLPSQEDLIIETAILLELFEFGVNNPGTIPLVFDTGAKISTYDIDLPEEETVSFAYQYNCRTVSYSGIFKAETGIFKHYAECWNDYNDFMLKKINLLPANRNVSCLRLDIHRYYDSISKIDIQQLFSKIFTTNCLNRIRNESPAIRKILGDNRGEYLSRLVDWVCKRSFAFQYYDPTNGNPCSSILIDKGIPQGPNLSAWMANILLFEMDRKVKAKCQEINCRERKGGFADEQEEVSWYARYVDDMVIAAPTKKDTETLRQLIQIELEKLGLFLSTKIDDEVVSSRDDLYEMIRKNRGLKSSPYGGENIDYIDFDYQDITWKSLIGNLDRKNFLSYIYSEDAICQAFNSDDTELYNTLRGAVFSSNEVRYRDYRRVVSLLLYSIFSNDTESYAEKLIEAFEYVIEKLERSKEEEATDSLLNINFVWPLFSIFESIQNVLVKRYDLIPVLPISIREKITNVRKQLAHSIINDKLLDKITTCVYEKIGLNDLTFSVLLKTWQFSLTANAYFFLKCDKNSTIESKNILHFRYLLSIPSANLPVLANSFSQYHSMVLAFHKIINDMQKANALSVDNFNHIKQTPAFRQLSLLCEHKNTVNKLYDATSTELFDALTTFANTVPADKQFDQLRKRTHLLCQELSSSNMPIRLISSPIDEQAKYVIAFIHDNNKVIYIKIVTPKNALTEIQEAIFPQGLLSFVKNIEDYTCKLDIYSSSINDKNICIYSSSASSPKEQLLETRKVFTAILEYKHDLPNLIFSKDNLILINNNPIPFAWKSNSVYSKAIIGIGKTLELSDSMIALGKAGCTALEAAKVTITSGCDVLAKISQNANYNYEDSNWIYEHLLQYTKSLLTGKRFLGISKFYKYIPSRKITSLWNVIDKLSKENNSKALLTCFFNYRLHELVLQADIALNKAEIVTSSMGYTSNILHYVASRFSINDDVFFQYFKTAIKERSSDSEVQPYSLRKNVNAWYSLSILMEDFCEESKSHTDDNYFIALSFRVYALVTWLNNLSREFFDTAVSDEFNYIVIEKIERLGLSQGAWQVKEKDEDVQSRFLCLKDTFKKSIEQRNMTSITPLGWCIIAYTILGFKNPLPEEFLKIFAYSIPIEDNDSDNMCNILGDVITLADIDKLFAHLKQWENDVGVKVYVNSGSNPTTGSVVNINRQENVLYAGQINFAGLPKGDIQVEHYQTQSIVAYQWSEVWYDQQLKSVTCIGKGLSNYVSLLQVNSSTEIEDQPKTDVYEEKEKNSSTPQSEGDKTPEKLSLEDELKITAILKKQQNAWKSRPAKFCTNHHRIALFQFDIGYSSYLPTKDVIDAKISNASITEEDFQKAQKHTQIVLDKAIELCNTFNVEALLLPEYSVSPENIKSMIERLRELNSELLIWAGTFHEHDGNAKKILTPFDISDNPYLYREYAATLCIISKDGIDYIRNKKYPSIAGKEDFSPSAELINPLFPQNYPTKCKAGWFISELICSEIFMATSPANINTMTKHHKMLRDKYHPFRGVVEEKNYYENVVKNDLQNFSNHVGYCSEKKREVRRSILFVPAMTTRNDDFHILGQANFLAASLCTVFCNGVSSKTYDSAPHGGSCFIGHDSTNKRAALGHTPYSGFSPGIFIPNHGAALTKHEEALVIVDIDPFNMSEGRPRPQMLPIPLNLVAHLPFVPLGDKLKTLIKGKFEEFVDRIIKYQNRKNDKQLHKELIDFWDQELKPLIQEENENITKRFEALKNESTRIGSLPAFSAFMDIVFYE